MSTCILSVIKNERLYLDFWLSYHLHQGIGHIYLIEDIDSDSHKDITDRYPNDVTLLSADEVVTEQMMDSIPIMKAKGYSPQNTFFIGGLRRLQSEGKYDWCFTIDSDEFITFQSGYDISVVDEFKDYDAFILQWKNYNANGLIYTPDYTATPITEVYTEVCDDLPSDMVNIFHRCKSCRNLRTFSRNTYLTVHRPNTSVVKWCKTDFTTDNKIPSYDKVYIRHYITKSLEEYINKINKRGMFHPKHRKIEDFFTVYNPSMKGLEHMTNQFL